MAGSLQAIPANASAGDTELFLTYAPATVAVASDRRAAACSRVRTTRTSSCSIGTINGGVLRQGAVVGTISMEVSQKLTLKVKSRSFSESIIGVVKSVTGAAVGAKVSLSVSCGNPCKAKASFHGRLTLGKEIKGSVSYTDHVKSGAIHSTASTYTMTVSSPGTTPGKSPWRTKAYRCDDKLRPKGKGQGPGCVFPSAKPTLTTMTQLTNIAINIRNIQGASGAYGKPGGGHPLHREFSEAKKNANRRAVCPRRPPAGQAGKSCDEYPFASSKEGGTKLRPPNRGIAWVPVSEQQSQGGLLRGFYWANRMLDKDAFWVAV